MMTESVAVRPSMSVKRSSRVSASRPMLMGRLSAVTSMPRLKSTESVPAAITVSVSDSANCAPAAS